MIFSTKNREKRLSDSLRTKLWPYMAGIARNHGFEAVKVGGFDDHAHVLLVLPPTMPLAKAIQVLKACSSKWLNDTGGGGRVFEWQQGYGAFSVSASQTRAVISYIENQASHHVKQSYEEELRRLLKRYDIVYDPKYLLG